MPELGPSNDTRQFNADSALSESRGSKYQINTLKYPADLGSPDLKHYVQFAINVRGKSKMIPESKRLFQVTRDPKGGSLTREQLGSPAIRGVTAAAAGVTAGTSAKVLLDAGGKAATSFVSALSSKAGKVLNKTGATVGNKVTAVAGAGIGVAAGGAILATDILKPDQTFRISDAISLYVAEPPSVKYAMQYSNKDLGTLVGVLSQVGETQASTMAAEGLAALGALSAKLPGAFGGADIGSALSSSTGTALNPFKEVIFEAVDFRSFAFKYKFLPKSQQEADEVKRIINLFKYHMHPELSETKLFYIYPSEFQITYYYGSAENEYVHKFRPCVLEAMDVTYGGETFSSFKDGKPTEVNISLVFRETEILTRNLIGEDGEY